MKTVVTVALAAALWGGTALAQDAGMPTGGIVVDPFGNRVGTAEG